MQDRFSFREKEHCHDNVGFKNFPHKKKTCQEDEAESSNPPVDQASGELWVVWFIRSFLQDEDWQHHPLQRQEEALETHQAGALDTAQWRGLTAYFESDERIEILLWDVFFLLKVFQWIVLVVLSSYC